MTTKNEQSSEESVVGQGTETERKRLVGGGRALQILSSAQSAYERCIAHMTSGIDPHAMGGGTGKGGIVESVRGSVL